MEHYFIKSTKYSLRERNITQGKVYDVIFRVIDTQGKAHQKVLSGYKSKGDAKRAYAEFVSQHCNLLPNEIAVTKKNVTIAEAFGKYISIKSGELKESSIVSIQNAFRKHIIPDYGDISIDDFKKQDALLFIDKMCTKTQANGKPYSRKYINTVKTFFSAMYKWLASRFDVSNPFDKVSVPKGTKQPHNKRLSFWEREDFEIFISKVDNPLYHAFFTLLYFSGMRKSEAFALTPKDYDGDSIHVFKTISRKTLDGSTYKVTANKNAKDYRIPVCEPLRKELDAYLTNIDHNSSFLFGGETPLAPTSVQRAFSYYIKESGVPEITIHGLRHSFVSMCIHHGANYMVVADLICDSPEQVLHTYGHMWDSDKRTIIDSIK